jgi:predicted nucleotidyltransferase
MTLSKRYLNRPTGDTVDFPGLGDAIREACPEVVFAYVHGSAAGGEVEPYSDLDIAVYLSDEAPLDFYGRVSDAAQTVVAARPDVGILNEAEPVYRFEALKGRLLFTRDPKMWLRFYSITCREYEHQMVHYERQLRYRLKAHSANISTG